MSVGKKLTALNTRTHGITTAAGRSQAPFARERHVAWRYKNHMMVFGGCTKVGLRLLGLADLWAFDLDRHCWQQVQAKGIKPCARQDMGDHPLPFTLFNPYIAYDFKMRNTCPTSLYRRGRRRQSDGNITEETRLQSIWLLHILMEAIFVCSR